MLILPSNSFGGANVHTIIITTRYWGPHAPSRCKQRRRGSQDSGSPTRNAPQPLSHGLCRISTHSVAHSNLLLWATL